MAEGKFQTHRVRVYYEDTDFSGVVYHAAYLKFFERGRTEALRASGVRHSELLERDEPLAFAVHKMSIEWISPARIDDELEVRTNVTSAKGARLLLDQTIWKEETLVAKADVEAVCMTLSGRPRRLPPEMAARLSSGNSR